MYNDSAILSKGTKIINLSFIRVAKFFNFPIPDVVYIVTLKAKLKIW